MLVSFTLAHQLLGFLQAQSSAMAIVLHSPASHFAVKRHAMRRWPFTRFRRPSSRQMRM
jgi:hypothetical protein